MWTSSPGNTLVANFSVIQEEVDELLVKGAIELSTGDADFHSKCLSGARAYGSLCPRLNHKQFNHYANTHL